MEASVSNPETNNIPFDYFWNNYGHFQLQNQQNSSNSLISTNCSFENLSAMQESKQIDLRSLLDENHKILPNICQCTSFNSKISPQAEAILTSKMIQSVPSPLPKMTIPQSIKDITDAIFKLESPSNSSIFSQQKLTSTASDPSNITPKIENVPRFNVPSNFASLNKSNDPKIGKQPFKVRRKNFESPIHKIIPDCENEIKAEEETEDSKSKKERPYKSKTKRFEWSAELHEEFIKAYEMLTKRGYPTPKQIMAQMIENGASPLMKGLTRIHVNTHLQKYELSITSKPKRKSKFFAFRHPKEKEKEKEDPSKITNFSNSISNNSTIPISSGYQNEVVPSIPVPSSLPANIIYQDSDFKILPKPINQNYLQMPPLNIQQNMPSNPILPPQLVQLNVNMQQIPQFQFQSDLPSFFKYPFNSIEPDNATISNIKQNYKTNPSVFHIQSI